jgi:hypothetical protein
LNWKSFKNKDMEEIPKVIPHKIAISLWWALASACCGALANTQVESPAAAPHSTQVEVPVALLQQHTGFYSLKGGQRLWVRLSGRHLVARLDDLQWGRLLPLSPKRFALVDSPLEIEFDARPGQRANLAAVHKGKYVSLLLRTHDPNPPFASVPFFLRGSMNEWAATQPMRQTDLQHYVATLRLPVGTHEFKFGSEDWTAVDFGGEAPDVAIEPGRAARLAPRGANLVLQVTQAGQYRFALDTVNAAAPAVTVTPLP